MSSSQPCQTQNTDCNQEKSPTSCHPFFVYRWTSSCLIYVVIILNSLWLLSTHCSFILAEYLLKGQIKANSGPDIMFEICALQTDMHVPLRSVWLRKLDSRDGDTDKQARWRSKYCSNVAFLLAFTSSSLAVFHFPQILGPWKSRPHGYNHHRAPATQYESDLLR